LEESVVDPLFIRFCSADIMQCIASLVNEHEFPEAIIGISTGISAFLFIHISIVGFKSATVTVSSELPLGSGLGSFVSFCVVVSGSYPWKGNIKRFHAIHLQLEASLYAANLCRRSVEACRSEEETYWISMKS